MTNHHLWAIVLAAGQGSRIVEAGIGIKKQFMEYQGNPLFWHSVQTFSRLPSLAGIMLVFPEAEYHDAQQTVQRLTEQNPLPMPLLSVVGGERRQDSVYQGLVALPSSCTTVLVHDAARPFFSPTLVTSLLQKLTDDIGGVIPGSPVTDTIKETRENLVVRTLERSTLTAVQTPQLFHRAILLKAHEQAALDKTNVTDDASMVEHLEKPVALVPGEPTNIKITHPEDLNMLANSPSPRLPVTGFGYDVHKYKGQRDMVLGGIPIPGGPKIHAHSDGDVLIHALCDALLGCLGQGDIGDLFPDSDATYENMPSSVFLAEILDRVLAAHFTITHVDLTIVAQIPKISPFKAQIKKNIASLMSLSLDHVNVKATTEEEMGFTGTKQGIKAMAVVTGTIPQNTER